MSENDENPDKFMDGKNINKRLSRGEWIFSFDGRLAYKIDKQGSLIFNCTEDATDEEKLDFTIDALVHLGVDETKAEALATHMGTMQ